MGFEVFLILVTLHFVGDFLFQTDWMATNKSSSNRALTIHVATYMIPFAVFYGLFYTEYAIALVAANFVFHWATDFTTSRIAGYFYQSDQRSLFFKTIGADQLIHYFTLVMLHIYIVGA